MLLHVTEQKGYLLSSLQRKEREVDEYVQLYKKAKSLEEMVKLTERQQQSGSTDVESEMEKVVGKLQTVWTDVTSSFKSVLSASGNTEQMEVTESELSDCDDKELTCLAKLNNMIHDIYGMKEWAAVLQQSEKHISELQNELEEK
ncbi:uncharacterized protein [Dysidea avara]|uniref:uncharacterized protein isoform X3 n=1 Tax=Dysidea avara TaxID=196820 RepID=UPI00332C489E